MIVTPTCHNVDHMVSNNEIKLSEYNFSRICLYKVCEIISLVSLHVDITARSEGINSKS